MALFNLPFVHVNVYLELDGQRYEAEHFSMGFAQDIDYKGQPQHEVKGGQLSLTFTQAMHDTVYIWAKKATLRKSGKIIFWSEMAGTILQIDFENANCIHLTHKINALTGTETTLAIAPEAVTLNGMKHTNKWRNK
ncbi:MAG: hypothetical protein RL662_1459 [Bacteroidota bacterium]|jgi:hypothetical protein